ncbi:hypothetical protein ACTMSW_13175 [Micromonospora sp. BQ11]|uniref:hypothetical protein n=1 Tax=Micromonospora sp. BQ11 TaxID=3452212 RepID=UPI003F8C8B2E
MEVSSTADRVTSIGPDPDNRAARVARTAALFGAPALIVGAGVLHPHHLTPDTAGRWLVLHLVLLPVFPLLAVPLLTVVRSLTGPSITVVRLGVYVYAIFYTGLDAVSGIAAGRLMLDATAADEVQRQVDQLNVVGAALGITGSLGFMVAAIAAVVALAGRYGRRVTPGAVVLLVASVPWLVSHIYWPHGVVVVLALGAGMALLEYRAVRPAR